MTTGFIVVIPARYASTRLPGKPLKDIAGKPMIEWVYRQTDRRAARARSSSRPTTSASRPRAARSARAVELTATEHASGTDRIAELARRFAWDDGQIVVNVQGDEPLISPVCIAQTARLLGWHPQAAIATLMTPLRVRGRVSRPELRQGRDGQGRLGAVLQPRADPVAARWRTAGACSGTSVCMPIAPGSLKAISAAPPCALEEVEKLEQLRALWLGLRIIVAEGRRTAVAARRHGGGSREGPSLSRACAATVQLTST